MTAPPAAPATKEAGGPGAGGRGMGFGGTVLYAAVFAKDRLLLRRGDKLYCVAAKSFRYSRSSESIQRAIASTPSASGYRCSKSGRLVKFAGYLMPRRLLAMRSRIG